ncbi:hypothetical protein N183_23450 [Sinorhizobium sp. Sb3]|uniref:hypothetical protein n=1 Tax=Sinorhizobium sp. Sb3 TaxID=1358417 RepID=UPI00071DAE76|nr:hypothetical protein [Sinorhizobium sp. Sb3]KSV74827.1 hypothetical protein N183_23450 [Sinorhizobium sp. Sb3]
MTPIEYLKLQAKNLFRDFKTKTPVFDKILGDYLYEYNPKFFDIDRIVVDYDLDEDDFSLMNAQHVIAHMVGFRKWTDLVKASEAELELAKLLFDNQHKIYIDDWQSYIAEAEDMNGISFDPEARLAIFKEVFVDVDGHDSPFGDFRLNTKTG